MSFTIASSIAQSATNSFTLLLVDWINRIASVVVCRAYASMHAFSVEENPLTPAPAPPPPSTHIFLTTSLPTQTFPLPQPFGCIKYHLTKTWNMPRSITVKHGVAWWRIACTRTTALASGSINCNHDDRATRRGAFSPYIRQARRVAISL